MVDRVRSLSWEERLILEYVGSIPDHRRILAAQLSDNRMPTSVGTALLLKLINDGLLRGEACSRRALDPTDFYLRDADSEKYERVVLTAAGRWEMCRGKRDLN